MKARVQFPGPPVGLRYPAPRLRPDRMRLAGAAGPTDHVDSTPGSLWLCAVTVVTCVRKVILHEKGRGLAFACPGSRWPLR
jgi:hypothetical protein